MSNAPQLVQKLWNYCSILRDDGLSYGDYVEQLTFLLFLKMAEEQSQPPFNKPSSVPKGYDWPSLLSKNGVPLDGDELETHYRHVLETLGKRSGMLGVIFRKAQNKIQDPAKLRRLIVDLIDKEQWTSLSADVKGDAYEGLLQKNAEDVKGGAGQYFTPRPLIAAMVEVIAPQPGQTICDPACGTGGFLLAAHDYIAKHHALDRAQKKKLKSGTLYGIELVDSVARLCCMNLLLHGIGGDDGGPAISPGGVGVGRVTSHGEKGDAASGDAAYNLPVVTKDALAGKHGEYEIVLANPPFGKKSSVTIVNDAGDQQKESLVINRDDFWASTSNKQLNFLQHIFTILKQHGRAAVVLPDNVLFEGGAGETIRRELLKQADVHTLLRLPTGIFYAQGVKANVLFFDRKPAQEKPWTQKLWIYDLRTNKHFTLKESTLQRTDLDDFVACWFGNVGPVTSPGAPGQVTRPTTSRNNRVEWTATAKSVFLFDIQGSVAKSTHAGLPWLRYVREHCRERIHWWPFDGWEIPQGRSVMAEVYPSLWMRRFPNPGERTSDQHAAYAAAAWLRRADMDGSLVRYFDPPLEPQERTLAQTEGWILGVT